MSSDQVLDDLHKARRCSLCGRALHSPAKCPRCGKIFCRQHLSPRSHGCVPKEEPRSPGLRKIALFVVLAAVTAGVLISYLMLGSGKPCLSPAVAWITDERIRAGYCDPGNSTEVVQKLADSGVNTVITYFSLERIEEVAPLYRDMGLHLFISIPFLVGGTDYRHSVKKDGEEKVAPCPLDSQYWRNVVMNRLMSIAEASKEYPIDGVLINTEMSASKSASYYNPNLCFCDDCLQRYARATGKNSEELLRIPRKERYEWLESRGYLEEYYHVLETRVEDMVRGFEDMVRGFEEEIHEVNPDLLLGFLLYEDNWYYRALARGLSTPSMPVLVLDETTYIPGYTYLVDEILEYFQKKRMNVLYLPGLWLLHHTPEYITAQMYHLAANTSGYWVFPLASLWTENLTGDCRLAGPREGYWNSLKVANTELDRYLTGGYTSDLSLPASEISPFLFGVLQDQEMIVIENLGFCDRRNVKVAINGELAAKIPVIKCKSASDPIPFQEKYLNISSGFSAIGLYQVAVMDSSGRVYDLLGETDPSVFSK